MIEKNLAQAGAALALMGVDEPWRPAFPINRPTLAQKVRTIGRRIA